MNGDLVFIGDVHLDRDDPDLPPFLAFLDRLGSSCSRIVLMGDLFNLWIGRAELEQPHQRAVVAKLQALRRRGVVVRYLEGNRDYRIGHCHVGSALDEATDRGIVESFGGRRIVAIHGDMANAEDRSYRRWRWFSRSRFAWLLFNLVPRGRRLGIAESLERRLRSSNKEFKQAFPEATIRGYAASVASPDDDALVLGHFHVEKELAPGERPATPRILVLPCWKDRRRHLRVDPGGEIEFVDSE